MTLSLQKPRSRHAARISFLLALSLAWSAVSGAAEVGKPLPDPQGFAFDRTWPSTRGKVVLVDFWASWCGPCKKSFPSLEALHQRYKAKGLVVVGVSVDEDPAAMVRFLKQHAVSFPTVRDKNQKFVQTAKIAAMPTSLLVDRRGTIRFVNSGFKGSESEAAMRQQIEQLLGGAK